MGIESFSQSPNKQEAEKTVEKQREVFLSDKEVEAEIRALLGDLATVESLDVSGVGSHFEISGKLDHKMGGRFGIRGSIESGPNGLQVSNFTVEAGFLKKGIIQGALNSALPKLIPGIRSYLEGKYGEPVKSLSIEHGALRIGLTPEKVVVPEEPKEVVADVVEVPIVEPVQEETKPEAVISETAEPIEPAVEEPEPASETVPEPPVSESVASVPFMITREMHQSLADLGYTKEERGALTPAEAHEIIGGSKKKERKEVQETRTEQFDDPHKILSSEEQEKLREMLAAVPLGDAGTRGQFEKVNEEPPPHFDESKVRPENVVREIAQHPDEARAFLAGLHSAVDTKNLPVQTKEKLHRVLTDIDQLAEDYMWSKREGSQVGKILGTMKYRVAAYFDILTKAEQEEKSPAGSPIEEPDLNATQPIPEFVPGPSLEDTQEIPAEILEPFRREEVTRPHDVVAEGETSRLETVQAPQIPEVRATVLSAPEERREVLEAIAALPEKSRAETLRGWAGVAFTAQEMKNKGIGRALRFAAGLFGSEENRQKADSKKSSVRLFLDAFGRQYEDLARTSETQREIFVKSGRGIAGLATNAILTTRAGLSLFGLANPIGNVAAWGALMARRGVEAAKETHFAKRSESFRVQDETRAWEEAERLEELASSLTGKVRERVDAGDISRVYLRELPQTIMGRLALDVPLEEAESLTAKVGVLKILAKIRDEIAAQPAQEEVILKTYEKKLRDLDRIVGDGTTIDVVGKRLMDAGVWSERIAKVVALESLAEGVYHIEQLFAGHGVTEAAHTESAEHTAVIHEPQRAVESAPPPVPTHEIAASSETLKPIVIEHGGNIWSSAHEAAEKAGLAKGQFAEVWGNSHVTLPDGREISLAELNLVHEGDTLSYVPGENGEVGHFEFHNASDIPYGDSVALPGAEEVQTGDQLPVLGSESIHLTPENIDSLSVDHPIDTSTSSEGLHTMPQGAHEGPAFEAPAHSFEEHVAREFDNDMRALFGNRNPEVSEWQQWKGMSTKKFLGYQFERGTPAYGLHRYIAYIMKESHLRPKGGLFRRDETMDAFVRRALSVILSKERRG